MGLWQDSHAATIDPERFRANNQYLYTAGYPHAETLAHIRGIEPWLLTLLKEDDAFGCDTQMVNGVVCSRDLLDSSLEITFLTRVARRPNERVIDIGAGYGRFAHRFTTAFPQSTVYCVDAVPISTLLCAKYLAYRGCDRAIVVSPDKLSEVGDLDLAVNIHSWSECTLAEVTWWLDWLAERRVPQLFVLPHDGQRFGTYDHHVYRGEIEARGYRLRREWTGPPCNAKCYFLFGLEGT